MIEAFTGDRASALDEAAKERLAQIKEADIVIGIPSYNNAGTIGRVIKAAELGAAKYFPGYKAVIIISEGGDAGTTSDAVDALSDKQYFRDSFITLPEVETEILVTKYRGPSGKGTAMKAVFEACDLLNIKAGCMLDSDLRSISPEWIELLLTPVILKDFGFVTPYYSRHKYDGTITNMIAYPLTCALYGRRVRQPIGGDFGFSLGLVQSLLSKNVWETDIARFGIDIWMTTVAICENFKICQSFLGAKIHDEKDPGKDLSPMFRQVVGTIFELMVMYEEKWIGVKGSRPTAIFGFETEFAPKPLEVDPDNMIAKFREGVLKQGSVWGKVLDPENLQKIHEVARLDNSYFELPIELWVRSLYDFAIAYKKQPAGSSAGEIIEAFVPLYYAMTASFIRTARNMDCHQAEEIVSRQRSDFEKLKPYLVSGWALQDKEGEGK